MPYPAAFAVAAQLHSEERLNSFRLVCQAWADVVRCVPIKEHVHARAGLVTLCPILEDVEVESTLLEQVASWPALHTLKLYGSVQSLSRAHLPVLRRLEVTGNVLIDVAALVCPQLHQLQQLELGFNNLGDAEVQTLMQQPWPELTHLGLGHNDMGHAGLRALAQAHLPRLEHLDLCNNDMNAHGVHRPRNVQGKGHSVSPPCTPLHLASASMWAFVAKGGYCVEKTVVVE